LAASSAAFLVGTAALLACWAATDYDPVIGRELRYLWFLLLGLTAVAVVMHYPWSPRWVAANGCKPDAEPHAAD
jgi:hypothetical protein